MDIDLLFTADAQAGLVSDTGFENPVAGVMFDAQTYMFSLEFSDMESMELNIPLDSEYVPALLFANTLQVGVIENNQIEESWQVPLLLINNPYENHAGHSPAPQSGSSVLAFGNFLKNCSAGQPIHREDLGDEASAGAVMGGMNTAVLQFAPHLARQRALEAQPKLGPAPNAPGMGMGGGGGGPRNSGNGPAMPPPNKRQKGDDQSN